MRYFITTMILLLSQLIGVMAWATTPCPPLSAITSPPADIHNNNVMVFIGTLEQGEATMKHIEGCMLNEAECTYPSHSTYLRVRNWEKNAQAGKERFRILSLPTCQPNLKPMETGKSYRIYGYPNKYYGEKNNEYPTDREAEVSIMFYERYVEGKK